MSGIIAEHKERLQFLSSVIESAKDLDLYQFYLFLYQVTFSDISLNNKTIIIQYSNDCEEYKEDIQKLEAHCNCKIITSIQKIEGAKYWELMKKFEAVKQEYILNFDLPKYILRVLDYSRIKSIS